MAIEKEHKEIENTEIEDIVRRLGSEKFDSVMQMCKGFKIEPLDASRVSTNVIDNKIVIHFNLIEDQHIILFGSAFLRDIQEYLDRHKEVMTTLYESIKCYNRIIKQDVNFSDYDGNFNYINNIGKISIFKPSRLTLTLYDEGLISNETKYDLVKVYNEKSKVDDSFFNFNGEMPIETWFLKDIISGRTNTSTQFIPIFEGEKLAIKNFRTDKKELQLQPNGNPKVSIDNIYLLSKSSINALPWVTGIENSHQEE